MVNILKAIYMNEVHRATKETVHSWTGNRHVALQTTEVAHFTQDEQKILHCGATYYLSQPQYPRLCRKAKTERGTHQNLNGARAECSKSTGSRLFVNHMLFFHLPFCNGTQNSKLLSCRYTRTLPVTVLTDQGFISCSTHKSLNHL